VDPRRQLIADAALAVLAESGSRGLTHHAVDLEAGLAKGSTSYYCRKRADLIELAIDRVIMLDLEDLQQVGRRIARGPQTPERAADEIAGMVRRWLRGAGRRRTMARNELFLLASREPTLDDKLAAVRAGLGHIIAAINAEVHPHLDERRLAYLPILIEGIMFHHVRLNLPAPPQAELAADLLALAGLTADVVPGTKVPG
jgi:DNA-binding transcriptional regulator YbjK